MESLLSSLLLSSGSFLTTEGLRAPLLCLAMWGRRRSNSENACTRNKTQQDIWIRVEKEEKWWWRYYVHYLTHKLNAWKTSNKLDIFVHSQGKISYQYLTYYSETKLCPTDHNVWNIFLHHYKFIFFVSLKPVSELKFKPSSSHTQSKNAYTTSWHSGGSCWFWKLVLKSHHLFFFCMSTDKLWICTTFY